VSKPASPKRTVVEADTELRGTLSSSLAVVVMGRIDGDLAAPALEVTETGVVSGKVKAAQITSRGELAGLVEAEHLALSGRVRDGTLIRAASLDVKLTPASAPDQITFGDCQLEVGEPPSKAAAIARARALPSTETTRLTSSAHAPGPDDSSSADPSARASDELPQPLPDPSARPRRRSPQEHPGETGT
jgi:hypothetical protein